MEEVVELSIFTYLVQRNKVIELLFLQHFKIFYDEELSILFFLFGWVASS